MLYIISNQEVQNFESKEFCSLCFGISFSYLLRTYTYDDNGGNQT